MNRKERRAQAKQGGGVTGPAASRQVASLFALACRHHQAGRVAEAETLCRQVLTGNPRHDDALHLLGVIAHQVGRNDIAAQLIGQAIALNDRNPAFHANLGIALRMQGRLIEATSSFRRALTLDPKLAVVHYNLGNALREQDQLADAVESYRQALALVPAYAEAHYNLGIALQLQRKLGQAEESYRQALALRPDYAMIHNNLGNALLEQGRLAEALEHYQRALALDPSLAEAHANLVLASLYQPGVSLAAILAAARDWDARYTTRFRSAWPAHDGVGRDTARPKIGFVSGDFRHHVVGNLVLPTVEALRRRGHELTCYYSGSIVDDMTARYQRAVPRWRPINQLWDEQVAELIRADGIDILFDLSGMTALNRLMVFARKPAPVQVAWFAYPATTGLTAMDYLLADDRQVPAGADQYYQEKIIRLPDSYVCYAPPPDAPGLEDLPCQRNGFITFGSFNEVKKISPLTVGLWSRILARVPTARLLLKARSFDDDGTRQRYAALFAEHGVAPSRLEFVGWTGPAEHMETMSRADVALDSFPYSGGATTLDTLWMGVPVITCPGETLCSRHATGYLSTIGHGGWIARDFDDYADLAVALANDPEGLAVSRAELRSRMASSPLCDSERFVRHFEAACTTIWARFLTGVQPEPFDVSAEAGSFHTGRHLTAPRPIA